jgi:class 3 adenylate cyclase
MTAENPPNETAWREDPGHGRQDSPHQSPLAGRIARVQLATLKDEVLAPLNAIIALSGMLLEDTREAAPKPFVEDLRKIHEAGQKLIVLVQDALQPASFVEAGPEFEPTRPHGKMRHDILNLLNPIINYCDMWLEDAEELFLQGFAGDLRTIRSYGERCAERIDRLFAARTPPGPDASSPEGCWEWENLNVARLAVEPGRLLIVDDNEVNRDILTRWLRKQGHTVTAAVSGPQALTLLQATPVDLLLLDLVMPEMTGFQVLQRLRATGDLGRLPVIMISALEDVDGVARCIELGAEDYLTKPFNPVLLQARIGACLEKKRLRDREALHLQQIEQERQRADDLLHVIFPAEIVAELKATQAVKPRRRENVAVLFADLVGFTPYCDGHPPETVLADLQKLVECWEDMAVRHEVEKIKTIGDAFMAASGLLKANINPVLACVRCGLEMLEAVRRLTPAWNLRVGIHAGQVVAGVMGRRQYLFDLWGDTVNTAARMESHGRAGAITLSGDAWRQIANCCRGESLGLVAVKGKGDMEMVRFEALLEG